MSNNICGKHIHYHFQSINRDEMSKKGIIMTALSLVPILEA